MIKKRGKLSKGRSLSKSKYIYHEIFGLQQKVQFR